MVGVCKFEKKTLDSNNKEKIGCSERCKQNTNNIWFHIRNFDKYGYSYHILKYLWK